MTSKELARAIADLAIEKKAKDISILDLHTLSDVTDYFVVCTGDSDTHVKAIADAIDDGMRPEGARVWRSEGYNNLQWVLLDFVDVVVHVFQQKVRAYYDLERLWGDAKIEHVVDPLEAKQLSSRESAS
ncbi:MAG: ribosome silencing factor [Ignavibacteria bacterium]|nr:ribosome silencing factor [Ignavibacteria bacterium]